MKKEKSVYLFLCIIVLVGIGFIWFAKQKNSGGFHQNGKVGMVTEEEKNAEMDSQSLQEKNALEKQKKNEKEKTKRQRTERDEAEYAKEENTLYSWWFKRNSVHEKSGCQEDFDVGKWGAYYTVPTEEKRIYFTFDCGYDNGLTADMLDVLKREQVPAAFFVTQTYIRDNISLVKRMKEEGHLVCNHTVHHPTMPSCSIEKQKQEIVDCENYMKEATGYEMDLFFRPPKGEYSKRTLWLAQDLGYVTVFWSMAYLDYDVNKQPSSQHVVKHFEKYHHPGAIPLLHNVSKANHDALSEVIHNLKAEGYTFGSLYEIKNEKLVGTN